MTQHEDGCPCVACNPVRCTACGIGTTTGRGIDRRTGQCTHRRACEGRRMIRDGVPIAEAAAHAQGLTNETEADHA